MDSCHVFEFIRPNSISFPYFEGGKVGCRNIEVTVVVMVNLQRPTHRTYFDQFSVQMHLNRIWRGGSKIAIN